MYYFSSMHSNQKKKTKLRFIEISVTVCNTYIIKVGSRLSKIHVSLTTKDLKSVVTIQ